MTKNGSEIRLVTQNIDAFHLEAKQPGLFQDENNASYPVHEIHGNILKARCDKCSDVKQDEKEVAFYAYSQIRGQITDGKVPVCPVCQDRLRPHIMFFDEFYTEKYNESESVKKYCVESDVLVVIGTALQTGLARMIVESFLERQEEIIEINTECIIQQPNTTWFTGKS